MFTEVADHSIAARHLLVTKLLEEADKSDSVPSDQFVLIAAATETAKEAGDLPMCMKAVDVLSASYEVDGLQIKADLAQKLNFIGETPIQTDRNLRSGMQLVENLVVIDDFVVAARVLSKLRMAAASMDPLWGRKIEAASRNLDAIHAAKTRMGPQLDKLKTSPLDPAANLAVGQFLLLYERRLGSGPTIAFVRV